MVERAARLLGASSAAREECRSEVVEAGDVLLAAPRTYMNRSGAAVRCLVDRHGLDAASVLVLYDEIHLPLGRLRLRPAGGPAGHRGMESIVESLGTDRVPRLRLGVGPVPEGLGEEGLPDFVLAPFLPDEKRAVGEMVERAAEAVRLWCEHGIELAMNRANLVIAPPGPAAGLPEEPRTH